MGACMLQLERGLARDGGRVRRCHIHPIVLSLVTVIEQDLVPLTLLSDSTAALRVCD